MQSPEQSQVVGYSLLGIIVIVLVIVAANLNQKKKKKFHMDYQGDKPQRAPTKKQRLELFKNCYTPRDKTLILFSTTTAIALETMSKLKFSYFFDSDWRNEELPCLLLPSTILKGAGRGKHKGTQQVCFLTPDTKRILLEYMDWFTKTYKYTWKADDNIFLIIRGMKNGGVRPLTYDGIPKAILKISRLSGVPFGIHDGRRVLQTAMESVSCPLNWMEKLKGRKPAPEEAYSKPAIDQLRAKFKEALPELDFLSPATSKISQLKTENEDLKVNQHLADKLSRSLRQPWRNCTSSSTRETAWRGWLRIRYGRKRRKEQGRSLCPQPLGIGIDEAHAHASDGISFVTVVMQPQFF